MFETFLTTLEQMLRIFLLLSVGYCLNKFLKLPKATETILSKLITILFLPGLMLYTNVVNFQPEAIASYAGIFLTGAGICFGCMILSYPLGKLFGKKDTYAQGVFRYAFSFPNTGAIATPLILAFFGSAGLFQFNLFWLVANVLTYTWGIVQLQPKSCQSTLKDTLMKCVNPNTVAMIGGMILGALGAKEWIPTVLLTTTQEVGNCYVVAGLLLTGFTIADYPIREIIGNIKVYLFALIRLVLIPGFFLALLFLLRLPAEICVIASLVLASPCGMNVVIFPAVYGQDCKTGASMLLVSSLFSVITVPVIYAIVQTLIV